MKTEDLIAALAADTMPRATVAQRLARALVPALLVSVAAFLLFWGPRADLGAALASPALVKTLLPLALAAAALALALGLSRPEGDARRPALPLMALGAGILVAFLLTLSQGGISGLFAALSTSSLWVCLISIPLLSALPLAASLWALGAGAPTGPARAGAAAGLAAGGLSAAVYSFYCDQDAALFFLPAYGAAMLAVTGTGALLGARLLRW